MSRLRKVKTPEGVGERVGAFPWSDRPEREHTFTTEVKRLQPRPEGKDILFLFFSGKNLQ